MNTTLVIMAAGMGSRFGGLKQAQAVTDDGKGILDFSVFDAKKAGFDKVVFIIRKDVEEEFKEPVTEVNETETSETLPALREETLSLSEPVEETLGDLPVEEGEQGKLCDQKRFA